MRFSEMGAVELQLALEKHSTVLVTLLKKSGGELYRDALSDQLSTSEKIPFSDVSHVINYARAEGLIVSDNERNTLYLPGKQGVLKTPRSKKEMNAKRKQLKRALSEYRNANTVLEKYRPKNVDSEQVFWAGVALEHQLELLDWIEGKGLETTGYSIGLPQYRKVDLDDLDRLSKEEFVEKYGMTYLLAP